MQTTEKTCFKCKQTKSLTEFHPHKRMRDGHLNKCKECACKDVRENRLKRIEYYRSFDKMRASLPHRVAAHKEYARTLEGKASHAKANARWTKKYPERKAATQVVNNALRDGRLQKLPCFICGSEKVEAHHPAYDLPLVVTWLCTTHHKEIHWHMDIAA